MASDQTFVVVGASLAGAKAVETLREEGFDGRVVLIGAEDDRPYERPPLSKDYLRGEAGRDKLYVHDEGFYAEHDIELRLSTLVTELDPAASEVVLREGERIRYDKLLITTGAEPRRLPLDGADLDGVHYLRTSGDSDALRERIQGGDGRVVVVGAGWIGAEVGASARQMGREVTLLEVAEVPLERVLGREVGEIYRDVHVDKGVEFVGGASIERFEGSGRVERVVLADRSIDCDLVVIGVGVAPRTQLAEQAGLEVDNGIRVTQGLQTSAEGIYAAGDVANALNPLFDRHIRVEHWANALNQAPAAARSMLGQDVAYDRVPYFFSDQYDVGMEYSGYATDWDEVVFRGDVGSREFIAFWLKDGRVLAGMNVNVWDVTDPIQALVRSGQQVDRVRLADTDVALDALAAEVARA